MHSLHMSTFFVLVQEKSLLGRDECSAGHESISWLNVVGNQIKPKWVVVIFGLLV